MKERKYSYQNMCGPAHLVDVGSSWTGSRGYIIEYGHEDLFISCNRLFVGCSSWTRLADSHGRTASFEIYL